MLNALSDIQQQRVAVARALVTTGISDGIYAQILTGPEPGDTVYYSYYEAPELDHTVD